MGKGAPKEQTVTQTTEPSAFVKPYLDQLFQMGTDAADRVPTTPYGGDMFARMSETERSLIDQFAGFGESMAGLGDATQGAIDRISNLSFEVPEFGDSYFQKAQPLIDANIRPIIQQVNEQLMPSLISQSHAAGAFGGSRANEVLPSLIMRDANMNAGDIAARTALDIWNTEASLLPAMNASAIQAGSVLPELESSRFMLGLQPIMTQLSAEQMLKDERQREIDEDLAVYNQSISAPFNAANQLAGILGLGTGYSTSTGTTSGGRANPIVGGLGGALGGLGGAIGLGGLMGLEGSAALLGASNPVFWPLVLGGGLLGALG